MDSYTYKAFTTELIKIAEGWSDTDISCIVKSAGVTAQSIAYTSAAKRMVRNNNSNQTDPSSTVGGERYHKAKKALGTALVGALTGAGVGNLVNKHSHTAPRTGAMIGAGYNLADKYILSKNKNEFKKEAIALPSAMPAKKPGLLLEAARRRGTREATPHLAAPARPVRIP